MKRYVAEAIGTYALVFAGTGAVVANEFSSGAVTLVGISMVFGLVVMTMIYSLGDLSGAHINPAVTVALWAAKRFEAQGVVPYIVAQCVGALAASATLRALFPDLESSLGATVPAGPIWQSFAFEVLLTFFLVFVVLNVTAAGKTDVLLAGIVIGGTVAFEVFVGGPISGASMNPARSLGPAVVGGALGPLWVYLIAPTAGGLLAALVTGYLRDDTPAETDSK